MVSAPIAELERASVVLGHRTILQELSLLVRPGEVVGLLGPNGAGKTTALRALCGLVPLAGGRASIAGIDVHADPVGSRRVLGYVPDGAPLYSNLSGREHLDLVGLLRGLARPDRARETARLVQAFELGAAQDQPVGRYSRGMRQKLALACALLSRPPLLVLDEPLNGLDAASAATAQEVLRMHAREGGAILHSSHLLESAERVSTRVVILSQGRITAEGELSALLRQGGGDRGLSDLFLALTRAPDPEQTARKILGDYRRP